MVFKAGKTKAINKSSLETLGQSTVDLAKYTEDEFAQVASSLQGDDPFRVNFVAPVKPRQGMLVYADGTKWNPGSGEGFYEYTSGAVWVPLTMSEALFQAFLNASPATSSVFGAVKVDGTSIIATAGVISVGVPSLGKFKTSLGADVLLNNIATFFDGPSVAQGTAGTWLATGQVTVNSSSGASDGISLKLWDGTTVIASGEGHLNAIGQATIFSISGMITSPAGNIRISVQDGSSTGGKILFNNTGLSKDSTLSVVRIA